MNQQHADRMNVVSKAGGIVLTSAIRSTSSFLASAALAVAFTTGCGSEKPVTNATSNTTDKPSEIAESVNEIEFEDRSAELGIEVVYRNGEEAGVCSILESLGGGVGWFDFDRDGRLDLVAPRGGTMGPGEVLDGLPTALLRNLASGRFVDVSENAGLSNRSLYTHGVAIGDYDNDGFPDLLITGYGPTQLWRNLGDGTFMPAENWAGAVDSRWSSSAGWADFDNDGNLDIYVTRYVDWSFENNPYCRSGDGQQDICPPRDFQGLPDSIYRNGGDGQFADVSQEAGLRTDGKGLGILLADLDLDGDIDAYVCNDTVDNFLYINDGGGVFAERGLASGSALDDEGIPNGSMGVALCDVNRDSKPDIWVTNYERESFAIYRSEGYGQFLHVSRRYGISALGGLFVGFGTGCEDFDLDGLVDIAVANGHVIKYPNASPRKQLPLLLRCEGDRFEQLQGGNGSYFGTPHDGRGLASGDYDEDGDMDLAISNLNAAVAVLENQFRGEAKRVRVGLVGRQSNRDGVGARIALLDGETTLYETQLVGGGSYLSHHDRRIFLSWVAEQPDDAHRMSVRVQWPSGAVDRMEIPAEATPSDLFFIVEGSQPNDGAG